LRLKAETPLPCASGPSYLRINSAFLEWSVPWATTILSGDLGSLREHMIEEISSFIFKTKFPLKSIGYKKSRSKTQETPVILFRFDIHYSKIPSFHEDGPRSHYPLTFDGERGKVLC
jgi:hypothetical protein